MKFLPSDPPDPVPGRVAQGGAAGPFLRGGRPPVDPARASQTRIRGAFGFGPKAYRFESDFRREQWDDLAGAPGLGTRAAAGVNTVRAGFERPPVAFAPPTPALPTVDVDAASWSLAAGLLVDVSSPDSAAAELSVRISPYARPGQAPTALRVTVLSEVVALPGTLDATAGAVARFGVPLVGDALAVEIWALAGSVYALVSGFSLLVST